MMIDDTVPRFVVEYDELVFITMSPKSISERKPRAYRSELRQQQAEATRSRVLAAAAELFAADGYARTTLAKIAAAAGVSAETVHGQGPKAALMIAAIEYAAFGLAGEENVFNLDVGRQLLAIDEYEQAVTFVVAAVTDVHERTAPLAPALFGGANADPELERYLNDLLASVNVQIRRILDAFGDRGWLRVDVPFDELVETTAVLCSVDSYLRITHHDGWSVDAYRSWCRRMLAEAVFHAPKSIRNGGYSSRIKDT
jgi:AcrR family transcriptional regulator